MTKGHAKRGSRFDAKVKDSRDPAFCTLWFPSLCGNHVLLRKSAKVPTFCNEFLHREKTARLLLSNDHNDIAAKPWPQYQELKGRISAHCSAPHYFQRVFMKYSHGCICLNSVMVWCHIWWQSTDDMLPYARILIISQEPIRSAARGWDVIAIGERFVVICRQPGRTNGIRFTLKKISMQLSGK